MTKINSENFYSKLCGNFFSPVVFLGLKKPRVGLGLFIRADLQIIKKLKGRNERGS